MSSPIARGGFKLPEGDHKTEGKAQSKPLFPLQSFALARFYPVEARLYKPTEI